MRIRACVAPRKPGWPRFRRGRPPRRPAGPCPLGSSRSVTRSGTPVGFRHHTSRTRLSELTSSVCACQTSRPPGRVGETQAGAGTPGAHARRGHVLCLPCAGDCRPQVSHLREPQPSPRGGSRRYHRSWARGRQPPRPWAWWPPPALSPPLLFLGCAGVRGGGPGRDGRVSQLVPTGPRRRLVRTF